MRIKRRSDIPDLQTQLESLLDQVWRSEDNWQLCDRIDAMVARELQREKRDPLRRPVGPVPAPSPPRPLPRPGNRARRGRS